MVLAETENPLRLNIMRQESHQPRRPTHGFLPQRQQNSNSQKQRSNGTSSQKAISRRSGRTRALSCELSEGCTGPERSATTVAQMFSPSTLPPWSLKRESLFLRTHCAFRRTTLVSPIRHDHRSTFSELANNGCIRPSQRTTDGFASFLLENEVDGRGGVGRLVICSLRYHGSVGVRPKRLSCKGQHADDVGPFLKATRCIEYLSTWKANIWSTLSPAWSTLRQQVLGISPTLVHCFLALCNFYRGTIYIQHYPRSHDMVLGLTPHVNVDDESTTKTQSQALD